MIRLCCFSFTDDPDKLSEGSIDFVYDAAGIKVSKHVSKKGLQKTYVDKNTFYGGNFIYKGAANAKELVFFNHSEGYVEPKAGNFAYIYQYKDHLGNIRLAYADETGEGIATIKEENNYYPFGLKHKGYNDFVKGRDHKWDFQGQERNEDFDLNVLEFQFRVQDPIIGRFWQIDPLLTIFPSQSPYLFSSNNPINRIDPYGLTDYNVNGKTRTIDDGNDDVSIKVTRRQYKKLKRKHKKNKAGYNHYMNRLSNKNGFTTFEVVGENYTNSDGVTHLAEFVMTDHTHGNTYFSWKNGGQGRRHSDDLGFVGGQIRSRAGSLFSQRLFENYWLAGNDITLTQERFKDIVASATPSGKPVSVILSNGEIGTKRVHSFYNTAEYALAFGSATIYYSQSGKPIGFYDKYDFDSKDWGERSTSAEIKTRAVKSAGVLFSSPMPFHIIYGVRDKK